MTLDLLIAVIATACAAIVIAALTLSTPASPTQRIGIAIGADRLVLRGGRACRHRRRRPRGTWNAGRRHRGSPADPRDRLSRVACAGPSKRALRHSAFGPDRRECRCRVFGYFFIIHYDAGRLPAPFAPSAGWGDVLPASSRSRWRSWSRVKSPAGVRSPSSGTCSRIVDLILAIGFGVTSAVDSPFRIFTGGPDTTMMSQLPMFLIPGFLCRVFILTPHRRLRPAARGPRMARGAARRRGW